MGSEIKLLLGIVLEKVIEIYIVKILGAITLDSINLNTLTKNMAKTSMCLFMHPPLFVISVKFVLLELKIL